MTHQLIRTVRQAQPGLHMASSSFLPTHFTPPPSLLSSLILKTIYTYSKWVQLYKEFLHVLHPDSANVNICPCCTSVLMCTCTNIYTHRDTSTHTCTVYYITFLDDLRAICSYKAYSYLSTSNRFYKYRRSLYINTHNYLVRNQALV